MGLPGLIFVLLLAGCSEAAELGSSQLALRPDTRDGSVPPPAYEANVKVEQFDSPNFRIHYTRTGRHAVASTDVPQTVSQEYERVLVFFMKLGFMPPRSDLDLADENGGDGRFDVYLVDFPTSSDGSFVAEGCAASTCSGYMLQENDFDGRGYPSLQTATRILASHELFHAVQNAYRAVPSSVLNEATAVWASERYDEALVDFEHFLPAYLGRADRSLLQEPSGPPDGFAYGASLFFEMIGEACDPALVHALWEELAKSDHPWTVVLDRVLQRDCGRSLHDVFIDFVRWNLRTGSRATAESYANASVYPEVSEQEITLPYKDDLLRTLPLSTHYFVANASGPIVGWANSDDVSWIYEAEGDRVHVALVDPRSAGSTLRVSLCIGTQAHVDACRGTVVEAPDATVALDASTTVYEDATIDAAMPEKHSEGCALADARGDAMAWLLALAIGARRQCRSRAASRA